MKLRNLLPVLASIAMIGCGSLKSNEPKPVIGKLTYSMDIKSPDGKSNPMIEAIKGFLPTKMEQGSNGVDFGLKTDGMQAMHIVTKTEEGMVYIAAAGEFIKSKLNLDTDSLNAEVDNLNIEELSETKEFLGMVCKGFKMKSEGVSAIIYVNESFELKRPEGLPDMSFTGGAFNGIKGTPLYVEATVSEAGQAFVIVMEATEFIEGTEALSDLLTPSPGDYISDED